VSALNSMKSIIPKILFISPNYSIWNPPRDGPTRRIHNIIFFLRKYFELLTLEQDQYKTTQNSSNKYYFNSMKEISVKPYTLGSYFADLNPSYLLTLLKIIKFEKPDLILVSQPIGVASAKILSKLFKSKTGKESKVIYSSHNVEKKYAKMVVYQNKNIPLLFKIFHIIYFSIIEYVSLISADYVFSVSHQNKKEFSNIYPIPLERIFVIQSGFNLTSGTLKVKNKNKKDRFIRIVFHGTYDAYRAFHNKEAVDIIINEISTTTKKTSNLWALLKI